MWQVIGQTRAVELLKRSLENDRLSHAYLFVGPPHVGKTTLAINLAQALNCEQDPPPCGQCQSCRRIAAGVHPDVQIVSRQADSESTNPSPRKEISIGQIKEVQRAAGLKPYEGRYRVFIIEGAEHLNEESANCLLKTLEEPPPHVIFILLAVSDAGLLPTIVSRCQRVELFPPPAPVIEQALVERWGIKQEKAKALSRLCGGGIGWAISASNEVLQQHSSKLEELIELSAVDLTQRFAFAARLATQFSRDRDSVDEMLKLWMGWWRDVLLTKAGCVALITNVDRETKLRRQAEDYTLTQVSSFMGAIRAAREQLAQNANPRLVFEVLMLHLPTKESEVYVNDASS